MLGAFGPQHFFCPAAYGGWAWMLVWLPQGAIGPPRAEAARPPAFGGRAGGGVSAPFALASAVIVMNTTTSVYN